jgi:hypothetical protein
MDGHCLYHRWWWLGDGVYYFWVYHIIHNSNGDLQSGNSWLAEISETKLISIDWQINSHLIRTCHFSWKCRDKLQLPHHQVWLMSPTPSDPAVFPNASRLRGRFEAVLFGSSATQDSQVWEKCNWLAKFSQGLSNKSATDGTSQNHSKTISPKYINSITNTITCSCLGDIWQEPHIIPSFTCTETNDS